MKKEFDRNNSATGINYVLILPLIVMEIYLSIVLILYVSGPLEWPTHNAGLFYFLILVYQVVFAMGYLISVNKKVKPIKKFYKESLYRFLKVMILINFIYLIVNFIHTVGLNSFSISSIMNSVIEGISNPSQQYRMKFSTEKIGGAYFTYFSVLLAPILWPVIPLALYHFKRLSWVLKSIVLMSIFLEFGRWIATGTSKGIIDLIVIFLVVFAVKYVKKRSGNNNNIILDFKSYKFQIIIGAFLVIGILLFSNNVGDRVNQNWLNFSKSNGDVIINIESPIMRITPDSLKPTIIYMTSYLTQGYYAFSMSLNLVYQPMYGLGNSMFLMENVKEIFGVDLYKNTYQSKLIIYGWDPFVNWHSFYVWVANDVHFIGVGIIMFLMGGLFGSTYKHVVLNDDPMALVLLCLTTIMIIYIPANNQVLSYPTTFMTFWCILLYWNFRKRYKLVLSKEKI